MTVFFALFLSAYSISQNTVTLSLDVNNGSDATTFSVDPDNNVGDCQNIEAEAWTYGGTPGAVRSFFAFDLSRLPPGIAVTNALLSLYYAPQEDGDEHSTVSGSNACLIQRITSDWDETLITWNNSPSTTSINQVTLPQSDTSTQDYPNINVTELVQDMMEDPDGSFGFMLRLDTEEHYRRMVFASRDHPDSTLHPKLVITYMEDIIPDTCIVVRLHADEGKDATIFSIDPNNNVGDCQNIEGEAWTYGGTPGAVRSFFEFDLSTLPSNIAITKALLSLYYAPQGDGDEHSTMDGSNACLIRRVTTVWDETLVTWNNSPSTTSINQVTIPQSTESTQDYPNINVTELVQDMIVDPDRSYGFMLRLDTEEYYRRMVFASGDHPDSTKHPELKICFLIYETVSDQYHSDNDLRIYPNPADEFITIDKNGIEIEFIELYNVFGARLRSYKGNVESINISDLIPGVYLIMIYNSSGIPVKFEKIIKN